MYFLISAALLVNAAFAANLNLGLKGLSGSSKISTVSTGLSGLSGVSGLSGLSGSIISSGAAPSISEVVVEGAANKGFLGGVNAGEFVVGGGASGLSGGSVISEQIIGGAAVPAISGGAIISGAPVLSGSTVLSSGALSTGFTPVGVTTYTAQAPAVKNIYRDASHVHPAKEIVYKIKTPPKVHQKVVKVQQVVKQPKINVLEVVQSPKIQKLSIVEKPAKRIVDVAPMTHTSTHIVVKAPEAPMTQKVFYSEKARESSGNIVSYEKHNIKPAQVSQVSAGAAGGVFVSHNGAPLAPATPELLAAGPLATGHISAGPVVETVGTVSGQTFDLGSVSGGAVDLGAVSGQTLNLGSVSSGAVDLGAVSGQTINLGSVSSGAVDLGAVSGQTLNLGAVGGQTFETTFGADGAALNLGSLGTGAVVSGADSETALNLGTAVGGGNVKTWVENNANGFTHHKVIKGGDLATWNAEFGSSTFGAGHDLNGAWKK